MSTIGDETVPYSLILSVMLTILDDYARPTSAIMQILIDNALEIQ